MKQEIEMIGLKSLGFKRPIARDLTIIIVVAILIRVALFFIFDYQKDLHGGDSAYYLNTGRNIVEHGFHGDGEVATFHRPPLYSVFAGVIANISETATFFYVVQSVLFICFSVAIYFLLRRYGEKLAFFSALLIAASPFDALINGRAVSENLVTPLLVLGTLVFINSDNSRIRFFLSGALLGGAALSRDIYLLLPLLFLVAGFFLKIRGRHLAIFLLGFSLLVAPWAYRNSQMPSGGLFLSKGILWVNLWIGVWERNADWTRVSGYILPREALETFDNGNSPAVVVDAWDKKNEGFFKRVTIDYVLSHPVKVVQSWITRYPLLWLGTRSDINTTFLATGGPAWYLVKISFYLINALVVVLGMLGLIIALRSRKLPLLLCLPVVYNALIYVPLHNIETRYSSPVMPILVIYGIFLLLFLMGKWQGRLGWFRSVRPTGDA